MGTWRISAETLAGARFVISPMADVVGALGMLTGTGDPVDPVFAARHGEAFQLMLHANPVRQAVVDHCWRPGWMANFLSTPPLNTTPTFDAEVAQLRHLGPAALLADLHESTPAAVPSSLTTPELPDYVAGLLTWIWTHTVAADWPRRQRILQADVVARAHTLATRGFRGVLKDLGRDREWARGELRINRYDKPTREIGSEADLLLIPVHSTASWVGHDGLARFAVYYPVSGTKIIEHRATENALARLIGPNRARILFALGQPGSPTSLEHQIDLPVGAVGNHLRILLDAGLVTRRRSGAHVLYWRTSTGDDLVAAST